MLHIPSGHAPLGLVSFRLFAACCSFILICGLESLSAQGVNRTDSSSTAASTVVVRGAELPSAYGAPPAFSRSRFSPTTTAYILPEGCVLAATVYAGDFFRQGQPDREAEVALPHRFGLTIEFGFEDFDDDDDSQSETSSLELRYALADSNEIPLPPPLFIEYNFGSGEILGGEGMEEVEEEPPEPGALRKGLTGRIRHSDEIEGRLLFAQDFGARVEQALNGFIEQETSGDRGREWGFAGSVVTALTREEWLEAGVEMQSTGLTDRDARNDPEHSFVIGPTIAGKPNRWSRLGVSPPLGITETAPRAQVFAVFSILFCGATSHEAGGAPSTRNC
jgi:hypothetical protein